MSRRSVGNFSLDVYKRQAVEREYAFCQLVAKEKYRGVVYQGLETAPENWQHAQNRLDVYKRQALYP